MSTQSIKPRSRAKAFSEAEWNSKRELLTKLYRNQGKSLKQVREILERHYDFHPTNAMLKIRIRKWNLERNHKEPDMLYALKIALKRQNQGKEAVIIIRDRVVTLDDIMKYFRRKAVSNIRSLVDDATSITATTDIECHTPVPSSVQENSGTSLNSEHHSELDADLKPDAIVETDAASEECLIHSQSNMVQNSDVLDFSALFAVNQYDNQLIFTPAMTVLDDLLYYTQTQCGSIWEDTTFPTHTKVVFKGPELHDFYSWFGTGYLLLRQGSIQQAFECFDKAISQHACLSKQDNRLLREGYARLLPRLHLLRKMCLSLRLKRACQLWKYVWSWLMRVCNLTCELFGLLESLQRRAGRIFNNSPDGRSSIRDVVSQGTLAAVRLLIAIVERVVSAVNHNDRPLEPAILERLDVKSPEVEEDNPMWSQAGDRGGCSCSFKKKILWLEEQIEGRRQFSKRYSPGQFLLRRQPEGHGSTQLSWHADSHVSFANNSVFPASRTQQNCGKAGIREVYE